MSSSGWILVLISSTLAVSANLMLRAGVDRVGGLGMTSSSILTSCFNLIKQPYFDIGIIMYGMATLVWIKILSNEPLSVAYPILVSITFMLVTLGAVVIFKETLNIHKILGLLIILSGIIIISRT